MNKLFDRCSNGNYAQHSIALLYPNVTSLQLCSKLKWHYFRCSGCDLRARCIVSENSALLLDLHMSGKNTLPSVELQTPDWAGSHFSF